MFDEAHVRREKWEKLVSLKMDPYPIGKIGRTAMCADALTHFEDWSAAEKEIVLAGRLLTIRVHGGMMFADLMDASGRMQIALKADHIGQKTFDQFRDLLDPGDVVEVKGKPFVTKRGEKTLEVSYWRLLAKALLPLPEKFHGLKDVELRYRHRELDLLSNMESRERFVVRSRFVSSLRHFLDQHAFMEVETPMLHPIPGGANAKPFVTHHNALDADFYLRIAPELYLKRLVIGGFEKVYEIGRCFRNEGIDYAHNPEFTMLELYWAFADKDAFFAFMEEALQTCIQNVLGTLQVKHERGDIDFSGAWEHVTFRDSIKRACKIDIDKLESEKDVEKAAKKAGCDIDFSGCIGLGECLDLLFKKTARAQMAGPTWVMDYPVETKPLANKQPEDPTKSATAQLVVHGAEIVNAYYHELNNPIEQRKRFEEQEAMHAKGSEESQRMDEPFLHALEHGMPPTSGMGMGVDRMISLLTNAPNLKEVILFPTLRPMSNDVQTDTI